MDAQINNVDRQHVLTGDALALGDRVQPRRKSEIRWAIESNLAGNEIANQIGSIQGTPPLLPNATKYIQREIRVNFQTREHFTLLIRVNFQSREIRY